MGTPGFESGDFTENQTCTRGRRGNLAKLETSNNRAFSEAGIERLFRISDRVMPVIWV